MKLSFTDEIKKQATLRQRPHAFLRTLFAKLKKPLREVIMYAPKDFFNPYQTLIYSKFNAYVTPVSIDRILRYKKMGISQLLHLHWDEYLFRGDAEHVEWVKQTIKKFKHDGGRVIWTVHNQLPHELTQIEKQNFLNNREFIIAYSDLIHVHSEYAKSYLQNDFHVPASKIFKITHPSYLGWYAEPEKKISTINTQKNFILFGNVRGNKGIDFVLDAFSRIDFPDRVQYIHIAGRGANTIDNKKLLQVSVKKTDDYIDDDEVPELFAEADYALFGFSSILTSGSLMLALTFGKPPICPAHQSIIESLPEGLHDFLYIPNDSTDFARVIDYATSLTAEEYEQKVDICLDFSKKNSPAHISEQLEQKMLANSIL